MVKKRKIKLILSNLLLTKQGNFLVMVSFIMVAFTFFFSTFVAKTKVFLNSNQEAYLQTNTIYAAESVADRLTTEYFQREQTTIFNEKEKICLNFKFLTPTVLEQGIVDFGNYSCPTEASEEIGFIVKNASRMQEEETFYLDRYQTFEYRLTASEFLEKTAEDDWYSKPEQLKISWWSDLPSNQTKVEIILVSWPQATSPDLIINNIQVQRINPYQAIYDGKKHSLILYNFSDEYQEQASLFCNSCTKKEYLVFIRALNDPVHIKIEGLISQGDDFVNIKIPSRFLFLNVKSLVINDAYELKNFTHEINFKKILYTDFDSNFPYNKFFIE